MLTTGRHLRITSVNLYRSPHRELPELSLAPSEVRESGVGYEYKCTTGLDVNPESTALSCHRM